MDRELREPGLVVDQWSGSLPFSFDDADDMVVFGALHDAYDGFGLLELPEFPMTPSASSCDAVTPKRDEKEAAMCSSRALNFLLHIDSAMTTVTTMPQARVKTPKDTPDRCGSRPVMCSYRDSFPLVPTTWGMRSRSASQF
jgi:hypothetical protein